MGQHVSRSDFEWSYTAEPHATRRKEILKKHPEIKNLFGNDPNLKWWVLCLVTFQFVSLFVIRDLSWMWVLILSYCIGGTINHSLMLAIHEISHNLAFGHSRPLANRILGIFANLPITLPFSVAFKGYHLEHHKYQGDEKLDTDIPTNLEATLFCTTLGKMIWMFFQPLFYALRPIITYPKQPTLLEFINTTIQLSFNFFVFYYFGDFRTFLSAAYRCEDAWSNRLKCPLVAGINSSDYIYDLDRKFKNEGKISAIDVDLLVNKLEPTEAKNINQDLEEVVQRLRRSPETIHTLPSTSHAVLRMLLDSRRTKLMLKFLSNPLEFGVFPDHYMSNLLMDTFIEEKNYTAAARVASVLMLQEDFGPPLTQALAVASCYLYATSTENLPWEDYTVKIEEPEEELKIRIPYLRNPYFDDHFDLKEPNHIVGKTLAWGAPLIGGEIGTNCEILGWALYNKWNDLEAALQRCTANSSPVAASVITSVKELVTSSDDSENQEKIMSLVTRLESSGTFVKEVNLKSVIEDHVKNVAAKTEADDIKVQEGLYATWEKMRQEEVEKQLEEYRRKQLLEEIERKKNELKTKEELFTFFENQDRLEMLLDRKPVVREKDRTHFFPHKIKKPKKVDEDYIPPEVIRR